MSADLLVSTDAHFPHSPGGIWAFVSRPENLERWVEGVSAVDRGGDGQMVEGMEFTSRFTHHRKNVEVRYVVLEAIKPRRLAIKGDGPQQIVMTLDIVRESGGAKVRYEGLSHPTRLVEVMLTTVLRPFIKRGMKQQLGVELTLLRRAIS